MEKKKSDEQNEKDLAAEVSLVISEIDHKRMAITMGGHQLKRSPYGTLKEKGMMNAKSIMQEFNKIQNKQSSLPSGERKCVSEIVMSAFGRLMVKRANKKQKEDGKSVQQ